MKTAFISYSQDSFEHDETVRALAAQLRASGVVCILDQDVGSPAEGWPAWMLRQIRESRFVLVVCSEGYLAKFEHGVPAGKGVKWEGSIITQELYESETVNDKFIPVLLADAGEGFIPVPLRPYTYYQVLRPDHYDALVNRLLGHSHSANGTPGRQQHPRAPRSVPGTRLSSAPPAEPRQSIVGNGNIQVGHVGGNVAITVPSRKKRVVFVAPAEGTIGANSMLKMRVEELFNTLGEEREKRFGKSGYSVMHRNFKRDFDIGKQKWTVVWEWPDTTAPAVIQYIEEKIANTIAGRKEGAAKKGHRLPTGGQLYGRERALLSQLDLEISSPEVHAALKLYFGVESHTDLTHHQHWLWVCRLEHHVRESIGEIP